MADSSITIVGGLGRDPEIRYTATGRAKATLGVAVSRRWQNRQTNEWEEQTSWFNVVVWGDMAENLSDTLSKGMRVIVTGRLEQRSWETEQAMRASARGIRPVRDQAAQTFGGSPTVDEWEIAVLHRDHPSGPGAGVRATWLTVRPDQFDRAIEFYRESVLPAIEELDGFTSASLMIDRASWRAVSSSTFDSLDAMQRNEEQADTYAFLFHQLTATDAKAKQEAGRAQ